MGDGQDSTATVSGRWSLTAGHALPWLYQEGHIELKNVHLNYIIMLLKHNSYL